MSMTASSVPPRARRAPALPRAERRAALIESTLALLIARGSSVTTRQIAEAAGIAEGTIFRVFPDKEALIQAAVNEAFDPTPIDAALEAIDRSLPFEVQLTEAVAVIQRRLEWIWKLMTALGGAATYPKGRADLGALAAIFAPERDRLRLGPERAAQALRALTLAFSFPAFVDEPMAPEQIVALLLDGIRQATGTGEPA
jgi:AcrR family transcriptional regulator